MINLQQWSNNVYKSGNYHIELFNDRWYIWDNHWVADFPTLEEVSFWIGEQ